MDAFTEGFTVRMVEAMDTPFLTIAEAVEKTGRSPSTIRRVIRLVADDTAAADRDGITPSPAEVEAFKKKAENFTWKIREDVLLKHLKGSPKEEKKAAGSSELSADIMHILEKELDLKNQQIEKQWEVIQALNDRLREGNILMGSLQKRLGPAMEEVRQPVSVAVEATTSAGGPQTPSVDGAVKAAKKNFLKRIFNR